MCSKSSSCSVQHLLCSKSPAFSTYDSTLEWVTIFRSQQYISLSLAHTSNAIFVHPLLRWHRVPRATLPHECHICPSLSICCEYLNTSRKRHRLCGLYAICMSVFSMPCRLPSFLYTYVVVELAIASFNDTNVSSCEVKKATPQSFVLVGRCTYLINYEYETQEVTISPTFWEFYDFIYGSFVFSFILRTETRFVEFH